MGKYGLTPSKIPTGVYPIFGFVAFACAAGGYYCAHMIQNPDNVFDKKNNPTPWESVRPNQTTKLYNPTGAFEENWKRDRL
ncbi:hypothetical protein BC833DRAFT_605487 [Globomyces pollinis-pini]|nr:hypothetical protein BC833DRAFT_605487 [Globomyces pollinis-pini]